MYQIQNSTKQNPLYGVRHIFSRVPNGRLLSNLRGWVGRSDSGVVVVVVGAEFSLPSSPSTNIGLAAVDPYI